VSSEDASEWKAGGWAEPAEAAADRLGVATTPSSGGPTRRGCTAAAVATLALAVLLAGVRRRSPLLVVLSSLASTSGVAWSLRWYAARRKRGLALRTTPAVTSERRSAEQTHAAIRADMAARGHRSELVALECIGLTEGEAASKIKGAGCSIRVTRRDTQAFLMTMDYAPSRINVAIEHGRIVDASVG